MNIRDLFRQLSFQELSNLSIGKEGVGEIAENQQAKVISMTNSALLDLHTRFVLRRAEEEIVTIPGQYSYQLDGSDVLRVLEVYRMDDPETRTDEGHLYGIHRVGPETGVRVDANNVIRFRADPGEQTLRVEYQAAHPRLEIGGSLDTEIEIEAYLNEVLRLRVASKIFQSMTGDGHLMRADQLAGQYEQFCARLEGKDVMNQTESSGFDLLHDRGFV